MQGPLPIIELPEDAATPAARGAAVAAVRRALSEVGFLHVRGHGLPQSLLAEAFAASRTFFAQPQAFKDRLRYTDAAANFGYQGIEVESLDPAAAPDLKESFTMRHAPAAEHPAARWPGPQFQDTATRFFAAGHAAALRILALIGEGLSVPQGFFAQRHRGEGVTLRFLHYPANLPRRPGAQLGAGEHTDYGSITLLFQDDVPGLEVQGADGRWLPAPRIEDAVLINAGDLLERWTNGRFRSTRHRVQPVTGAHDRHSIALFVDPDPEVEIACLPGCAGDTDPPRHPPITAREHIRSRLAATHTRLR